MSQEIIEKYEYFNRLDTVCDIAIYLLSAGVNNLDDLQPYLMNILTGEVLTEHGEFAIETGLMMDVPLLEAALKDKNRNYSLKHFIAAQKHLHHITDMMESGAPIMAHFPHMGGELYEALNIPYYCAEWATLYLVAALTDGVEDIIDDSHARGIPTHTCQFQGGPYEAMEQGKLPMPGYFMYTTAPCNSSNIQVQRMMHRYGIKLCTVDSPYYQDDKAFDYFNEEWRECAKKLSEWSGNKLDVDKLRYHCDLSNQQMKYFFDLQEIRRKARPMPDPGMHRIMDLGGMLMSGSSPELVEYQKCCYDEAKYRADHGLGVIPEGMKEIRTLHTYGWTAHHLNFPDWLEDELGSVELECGLSYVPWETTGLIDLSNTDTMIEGLARKCFNMIMHRTVMTFSDLHVQDMVTVAKSYGAEAAIFAGNHTCKWGWTYPKMLSEALQDNLSIPCQTFEIDLMDKRFNSPENVKDICREFFGTVRARKEAEEA